MTATFAGPIGTPVMPPAAAPIRRNIRNESTEGPCYSVPAMSTGSEPEGSQLPDGPTVTWLGHATAVAQLGSSRFVFDPLFRSRARAAGRVDAILVTHSHVDHLNRWSLKAIDRDTHLVVPRGAKHIVADLGFREVTEASPGDALSIGGAEVHAVETRHDQGRWSKAATIQALGYVVQHDGVAVHHAGDVDFSDHSVFDDIGKRFSLAASLLPIGGMMPVWYYRWKKAKLDSGIHIDPDCALDIYQRLGARAMVPVHWGSVHIPISPAVMAKKRLIQVASVRNIGGVEVLAHGDSLALR
ncbi:MAG TPA: MBL fold metallo-hydrolase [Kofleriaceae bacterium]